MFFDSYCLHFDVASALSPVSQFRLSAHSLKFQLNHHIFSWNLFLSPKTVLCPEFHLPLYILYDLYYKLVL